MLSSSFILNAVACHWEDAADAGLYQRALFTLAYKSAQSSHCAVPCHRRAAAVEGVSQAAEQLLETQDGEAESWVAPEAGSGTGPSGQPPEIPAIDDEGPSR